MRFARIPAENRVLGRGTKLAYRRPVKQKTKPKAASRTAAPKKPAPKKAAALNPVGKMIDRAFGMVTRALADEDSATNLLTRQHADVKALFEQLEAESARPAKLKIFEELAQNLVAHDTIEREIFYPACQKAMGMSKLLGEALVEHGVIEFCLYEADQARKGDAFAFKCQVFSEMVLHHVKEEERSFFPQVEKAFQPRRASKPLGKRHGAALRGREDRRFPRRRVRQPEAGSRGRARAGKAFIREGQQEEPRAPAQGREAAQGSMTFRALSVGRFSSF